MAVAADMSDESCEIQVLDGDGDRASIVPIAGEDITEEDMQFLQDKAAAAIESTFPGKKTSEEKAFEERARAEGKSTSSTKRQNRKPAAASDTELILKAIMTSDELAAKREDCREKR